MATHKCQCDTDTVEAAPSEFYRPEEYKAMQHKANECPGDFLVTLYDRAGIPMWLCSCCCLPGDIPIPKVSREN